MTRLRPKLAAIPGARLYLFPPCCWSEVTSVKVGSFCKASSSFGVQV
jgi:hypothetical protein